MEEEIKKLREAGFTDADIQAFVNDQKSRAGQPQAVNPAQVDASQPPVVDEQVPAYGAPPDTSMLETVATGAAAVAPYAAGAGLAGAGLYGASVAKRGFDAMKSASDARTAQATAQMAQAQGLQQRFDQRMAQRAMPPAPATGPQIVNASGQPMRPTVAGPVAPAVAAPATAPRAPVPQQPGMIQRGVDYANQMRQVAAQRVLPVMGQAGQAMGQMAQQAGQMAGRGLSAAAPALRVGGMAANAMYSGDLNANEAAELERRRKMAPTITR